jgi:hypothetical protein
MGSNSKSPAGILGIVGGALLLVGSFLTWVTLTLDLNAFAGLLGVDPAQLAGAGVTNSATNSGLESNAGKITLVTGIIVLVVAVLLVMGKRASRSAGTAMLVAGAIGSAAVLLNLATKDSQIDSELDSIAPQLTALGITKDAIKNVFEVRWGMGIYICLVGGILAIIAGIMAMRSSTDAAPIAMTTSAPAGGFAAPTPAPSAPIAPPPTQTFPPAEPAPPASPEGPPSSTP